MFKRARVLEGHAVPAMTFQQNFYRTCHVSIRLQTKD